MPEPEELDRTLDTLAEYVIDIGDELEEESVPNVVNVTVRDQEYLLTGHKCWRGDSRYVVAGHQDLRFLTVVYLLSLRNNLAADLDPEIAKAIVSEEYEGDLEAEEAAAEQLLDDVPRPQMKSFESYCYQFISDGTHETTFITNDEESFFLFGVSNDIFPYEDSFGISDFYEAVRSVVSVGERGNRLIGRTLYLDINNDSPEDTTVEFNFNW